MNEDFCLKIACEQRKITLEINAALEETRSEATDVIQKQAGEDAANNPTENDAESSVTEKVASPDSSPALHRTYEPILQ